MRVYRPSSLLMRKDSNSLLDKDKTETGVCERKTMNLVRLGDGEEEERKWA